MKYLFVWDPSKARANKQKHGVGFDIAATVLYDPHALSRFDVEHSEYEDRWTTLGLGANGILLVVIHTFEELDPATFRVRIISSRKATKREIHDYGEYIDEKGI